MIPDVSAVGATTAAQQSTLGGLDSQAFLKLLTAQMRFQNPMAPTDSSAMMQQTATFAQVESLQQIANSQQQMLTSNLATVAADLVGRHVDAERADGTKLAGTVDAVRFTAGGPVLSVGDDEIGLAAITRVSTAAPQASPASA
jgi:flagellar basal-body rod modification protein FlgD